jgi:hypothetical protein
MHDLITIGWRERLSLPDLGLALKAKIDTGARTSALHVSSLEEFERDGRKWLRFAVDTTRGKSALRQCEALALDQRDVTDSGGHTTARWFIRSTISIARQHFDAEINLTDRGTMLFPMLLGRSALCGRFVVDPERSYMHARRLRAPAGDAA